MYISSQGSVSSYHKMGKRAKGKKGKGSKDPITGSKVLGNWKTVGSVFTPEEGGPTDPNDNFINPGGTFAVLEITKGSTPYKTYYSYVQGQNRSEADTWYITGYADSNNNGVFHDSSPHVVGDGSLKVINRNLAPTIAEDEYSPTISDTVLFGTFESSGNKISYFVSGQLVAEALYSRSPWTILSF